MRSKITISVDSELLDIIKEVSDSDSDLDSIIQDALAQFLGIKQIWVKSNSLEPISSIPIKTSNTLKSEKSEPIKDNVINSPVIETDRETSETDRSETKTKTRRRRPKFVLKIWDKLKEELGEEFTTEEYWDATKRVGLGYKKSARTSTILEHLKLIEEAGKIIKISERPGKYRKIEEPIKTETEELEKETERELEEEIEKDEKDKSEKDEKVDSKPKLFEENNLHEQHLDKEILA